MPGGTKQLGLYFQDDWKVTKKTELELGVRLGTKTSTLLAKRIARAGPFWTPAINSPYAVLFARRQP